MPLFRIKDDKSVEKLPYNEFAKEREVQAIFENNLQEMLDLVFIKSEYAFPEGRMDSVAVDNAGNPVIIEYKLNKNENVLNQGLYYMDWLDSHRGDFELLVQKATNQNLHIDIKWDNIRLILIAGQFSKYDVHAVNAIGRSIDLFKYTRYAEDMLYLERINIKQDETVSNAQKNIDADKNNDNSQPKNEKTLEALQAKCKANVIDVFEELRARIFTLDDEISEKVTSIYVGFSTTRNFVEIYFKAKSLQCMILKPTNDPKKSAKKIPDSCRWTLNYRVDISTMDELDEVFELIEQSYKSIQ